MRESSQFNNLPQQTEKTTRPEDFGAEILGFCQAKGGVDGVLAQAQCLHKSRSCGNADAYVTEIQGHRMFLKSYTARPWPVRVLWGRRLLRHEFEVCSRLQGIVRVPRPYVWLDKDTFAMEFIPNQGQLPGPRHPERRPSREFCLELKEQLQNLHTAGVCHGDLRRANILIGEDGHPAFVDWATALWNGQNGSFAHRRLFQWLLQADRFALARILNGYFPDLVTGALQEVLANPPDYLRLGRFCRQKLYHLIIWNHETHGTHENLETTKHTKHTKKI